MNKSGCTSTFNSLYDAKEVSKNSFTQYSFNPDKNPVNNMENLLREYNKGSPIDIKKINFSPKEAMKTFAICLDILINYIYLVK